MGKFIGWYFKNVSNKGTVSFIPGRCADHAFIQVIETINNKSYYFKYDLEDYSFDNKNFKIKIGNNTFDLNGININLDGVIHGILTFKNMTGYQKSLYAPTIMGPLSYIPNFDCNHTILSMNHEVNGSLNINDNQLEFKQGNGYIEGDSGKTFPSSYLWLQGNDLQDSFVVAIANVKNSLFSFNGFFMVIHDLDKQLRFSTYDLGTISKITKMENTIEILIKQNKKQIYITIYPNYSNNLKAPIKGNMDIDVKESLTTRAKVKVLKKGKTIFQKQFKNCGFEITDNFK